MSRPPHEQPFASVTPAVGETPTASAQSTPTTGSGQHIFLAVGVQPLPEYTLTAKLGQGGFGEVWRASGPGGFEVALKFLRLGEATGSTELRALQTIKGIRHPNLLSVFGVWEKDNFLIIAMELADRSLLDRLKEAVKQGQPGIPARELIDYLQDAARGLDFLNEKGIQHRDVKPHNLFLYGRGVKVADFGLAKVLEQSLVSASTKMTPAYAAPEFLNGQASRWSDQYSLAATYCQLRTNRLPFTGTVMEILTGHMTRTPDLAMLPEAERPIVARALAKEPTQRWPSCREFVDALAAAILTGGAVPTPHIPAPPPLPPASGTSKTTSWKTPPGPLAELDDLPDAAPQSSGVRRLPTPPTPRTPPARRGTPWVAISLLLLLFGGGIATGIFLMKEGERPLATTRAVRPTTVAGVRSTMSSIRATGNIPNQAHGTPPFVPPAKGKEDPPKGKEPPPQNQSDPKQGNDPPPAPPTPVLRLGPVAAAKLKAGESVQVPIRLQRAHCTGAVTLQLTGLPPYVHAEPITVPDNQTEATITIRSGRGAEEGTRFVNVVATWEKLRASTMFRLDVEPRTTARQPWPVDRLVPSGTDILLHLNWQTFLQSSLARQHLQQPLQELFRTPEAAEVLRKAAFDPLKDLHSITACSVNLRAKAGQKGSGGIPYEGEGFFIVKGSFDLPRLTAAMNADSSQRRTTYGEFTLYELKAEKLDYTLQLVWLDQETLIAGPVDLVQRTCDAVAQNRPMLLKMGLLKALGRVRRDHAFWLAGVVPEVMRTQLRSEAPEMALPFAALTEVTLNLQVAAGIDAEMILTTPTADESKKIKDLLDLAKLTLVNNPNLAPDQEVGKELQALLQGVQIEQSDIAVTVRLNVSSKLLERFLDEVKKNMGR